MKPINQTMNEIADLLEAGLYSQETADVLDHLQRSVDHMRQLIMRPGFEEVLTDA